MKKKELLKDEFQSSDTSSSLDNQLGDRESGCLNLMISCHRDYQKRKKDRKASTVDSIRRFLFCIKNCNLQFLPQNNF